MSHNIAGIDLTPPDFGLPRQFLLWLINNFSRIRESITTSINGAMYWSTPAATNFAAIDTWVKLAGATTTVNIPEGVSMTDDNQFTMIAHDEQHVEIKSVISFTSGGNNQIIELAAFKNGVIIPGSTTETKLKTGTDVQQVTIFADVNVDLDDYIEIWVLNETSTNTVTAEYGQLHVTAHLH